jgi:hypothetical protein
MKFCPKCIGIKPEVTTCAICEGAGFVSDATADEVKKGLPLIIPDNRVKDYGINLFLAKRIPPKN